MNLLKFIQGQSQAADQREDDGTGAQHIDAGVFEKLVAESQVPVVVDFWAEWCVPCHMMAPSVDQLARESVDRAVVAKLNADEHPEILGQFGIMGIPTLIFFKDGKEADRVIGVTPYKTLRAKLDKLIEA